MRIADPVRRAAPLAAVFALALVAGCAEKAPPPVAEAPPPPPPPVAPAVALSAKLLDQAAAYRAYIDRASAISPAFADGASVAQSLRNGEAYEPNQLLRGEIAYGAVVALQDPGFRAGVRAYAGDAEQRRTIAYEIMKDPAYAVGIAGSAGAAGLVINALGDDGQKLHDEGKLVTKAAYDVQHAAWSKAEVSAREARLALAKELSSTPLSPDQAQSVRLGQAVTGAQPLTINVRSAVPPYSPVVVRALAVGALAALGYADDDASLQNMMALTADPTSTNCLNMAKLNLYQCLAVAKPHYEDIFCLGQHVLSDTGACLMKGAGLPDPEADEAKIAADLAPTQVSNPASSKHRGRRSSTTQ